MSESSASQSNEGHPKWLTYVLVGIIVILTLIVFGYLTGYLGGPASPAPPTEAPAEPLPTEAAIPAATEIDAPIATEAPPDDESLFTIIEPRNNTEWNLLEPIQVDGSAAGMPNENVLIFAVDADLNILGETSATLNAPGADGLSTYSGTLWASAAVVTDGKIVAGVLNDDGSIAGSAGVFVTMIPLPTFIEITLPLDGTTIPDPFSFIVEGTAAGLPENNVIVQATTNDGTVLAEVFTTVNTSELGGAGNWSVPVSVVVPAGTTGRILAYMEDPTTGGLVPLDEVYVTYGQQQ